ncbi:MAG: Integrase catalytic region [Actinomycetia bacterium]|nr:Integrase catalytic region [Actinomycetes bacterium]
MGAATVGGRVRAVLAGASVVEVAAAFGVSRISVHAWLRRYLAEGLAGLVDRSHRPRSCPHKVSDSVAVLVAEVRRQHPRWGAKRIRMELLRKPPEGVVIPSTATVNRILVRHGLVNQRKRKRPRDSYVRWQRPAAMQLWQLDIVGGVMLVDPVTGVLREAKVVTGVDDHSRFCVIASVVERATARAVCLALAAALSRFGVPEEILTSPSPLPPIEHGAAVEVDRVVSRGGTIALGGMVLLAAEILAGRQVGIRIEPDTLMFFDLQTRELLRVRPNPLSAIQVARLRGNRPAGPPPRPSLEPVRVQRRASNSGIVMVCGQKIALGRLHRWQTVTIAVSETTLAIELPDQEPKIVRRTTTTAVRNIKAARPRPGTSQVV